VKIGLFFLNFWKKNTKRIYDQKLKRKSCSQFFLFLENFRILATTQKKEKEKKKKEEKLLYQI
jgi:hypothetical protein